jgi:hypothetical protein
VLGNNPTWNCTMAHVSYQYDNFTGAFTPPLLGSSRSSAAATEAAHLDHRPPPPLPHAGNSSEYLQWQNSQFFTSRSGFNKWAPTCSVLGSILAPHHALMHAELAPTDD